MLFSELMRDTKQDCRRFYSPRTLGLFALGFGGAAAFANSELDNDFQRWYDEEIKNKTTDDFSSFVSDFGNGRIVVPALVATYLLGPLCARDHASPTVTCSTSIVAEWSNRCVRSLLVGGPPVLAMKYLLNASRPEDEISSRWRSFASPQSEGAVSGHAFVGATPFLNAARMTDRVGLKAALYCMSTWPAWSRVNDRMHYLSQAMLGWWIAYLATEVVDHTERDRRNFVIVPQIMDGGPGIGAVCWW